MNLALESFFITAHQYANILLAYLICAEPLFASSSMALVTFLVSFTGKSIESIPWVTFTFPALSSILMLFIFFIICLFFIHNYGNYIVDSLPWENTSTSMKPLFVIVDFEAKIITGIAFLILDNYLTIAVRTNKQLFPFGIVVCSN